jgi:hypothetical protein
LKKAPLKSCNSLISCCIIKWTASHLFKFVLIKCHLQTDKTWIQFLVSCSNCSPLKR